MNYPMIPESSVEWRGIRFLDPLGRTFRLDGRFYKAVYPGKAEADFVDPGRSENAARAGDQGKQDRRRQAVHKTKAGEADGHPVESVGGNRDQRHASRI